MSNIANLIFTKVGLLGSSLLISFVKTTCIPKFSYPHCPKISFIRGCDCSRLHCPICKGINSKEGFSGSKMLKTHIFLGSFMGFTGSVHWLTFFHLVKGILSYNPSTVPLGIDSPILLLIWKYSVFNKEFTTWQTLIFSSSMSTLPATGRLPP